MQSTMEGKTAYNIQYVSKMTVPDGDVEQPNELIVVAPDIASAVQAVIDREAPKEVSVFKVLRAVEGTDIIVVS